MTKPKKLISEREASKLREVDSYIHDKKTRVNNPRAGLAAHDEESDALVTYSFDPHSSPELQWAGKAEKDSITLPVTSIYTHEVVEPLKIVGGVQKIKGNSRREKYFGHQR